MKRALLAGALLCCALIVAGFGQQGAEFGRLGARGKASGGGGGTCANCLFASDGNALLVDTGNRLLFQ